MFKNKKTNIKCPTFLAGVKFSGVSENKITVENETPAYIKVIGTV